jgi:hypothetical protein
MNFEKKQSTVSNTAAGNPSLYSIKGTTSNSIYFKLFENSTELSHVLEKKVFWQPLHTPGELVIHTLFLFLQLQL